MPRISHLLAVILMLTVAMTPSSAAGARVWVNLSNCQYVAAKDNDGDSFRVRCNAEEFTLRLYFVDAPETNLRYPERTHEQSKHFRVTIDETLKTGEKARGAVQEMLRVPFSVWTRWANATGRGKEARYYALIEVNGKSLAEVLISQGLARTKGVSVTLPMGEKAKAYVERLEQLEREAEQKRLGAWATSSGKIPETPAR